MATVKFFIRTTVRDKKKPVNIRVRFRAGKDRAGNDIDQTSPSGMVVLPDNWNNKTQSFRQKIEVREEDRERLRKLRNHILDRYNARTGDVSPGWLAETVDEFNNPDRKDRTFIGFVRDLVERSEGSISLKTGKSISPETVKVYRSTLHKLEKFLKNEGREYDWKDIGLTFYERFVKYMESEGRSLNAIGKHIRTLNFFLNMARREGLISKDAFMDFKAPSENPESVYLDENELNSLFHLELEPESLEDHVRDLFLVGAWTGCRFSDISSVKPENIKDKMIHIRQFKTGKNVLIPLHPVVDFILKKHDGKLPPMGKYAEFNEALREVCRKGKMNELFVKGITKGGVYRSIRKEKWKFVTSHAARRSFATNLYKSGFPAISIMKITGHSTESSFLKYIRVSNDEHAKMLEAHWAKSYSNLKIVG